MDDKPGVELQFIVGGAKFVEGTPGCQARRFLMAETHAELLRLLLEQSRYFHILSHQMSRITAVFAVSFLLNTHSQSIPLCE